MPKLRVERSIDIQAPIERVYDYISDFHNWPQWSPWLRAEPEATVDTASDGKSYSWQGTRIGSGAMKVDSEQPPRSIEFDLRFLKPWKSTAKTSMQLEDREGSTRLIWQMDSKLPFFMFWMKNQMQGFIGSDYERGLSMIKSQLETGAIPSQLEWLGVEDYPGCKFIGLKERCSMDDIEHSMKSAIGRLHGYLQDQNIHPAGPLMTIMHEWDIVQRTTTNTVAFPVSDTSTSLAPELHYGNIPSTRVYRLRHIGPYEYLGNAWSTLMAMKRNKEFKAHKGIHPFETYVNNPMEVSPEEIITDIRFPIR